MKTVHVKHDWTRLDEPNAGHTPDEWGKKPQIIVSYKMKWEED